jgi:long-chain acyl-CoA synthetase
MNTKPWVKSYPPGVRWDAPLERASVQSVLETAAKKFGPRPALEFMDKRISYAELEALANRAAAGFQKLGVRPGVHVGIFMPNTPHYVITFFGVLKAGGTVVNYSPLDALTTLQFKIEDSETEILVTLDLAALYPQAEKLLASTRLKKLIVGEFTEMALAPGWRKWRTTIAIWPFVTSSATTGAIRSIRSANLRKRWPSFSIPAARPARPKAQC